jgi:hypothetical protein
MPWQTDRVSSRSPFPPRAYPDLGLDGNHGFKNWPASALLLTHAFVFTRKRTLDVVRIRVGYSNLGPEFHEAVLLDFVVCLKLSEQTLRFFDLGAGPLTEQPGKKCHRCALELQRSGGTQMISRLVSPRWQQSSPAPIASMCKFGIARRHTARRSLPFSKKPRGTACCMDLGCSVAVTAAGRLDNRC